jgi:hypothetical protein
LFVVAEVGLLPAAEAARLERRDAAEDHSFVIDGAFGRISREPPLIVLGRRSEGHKCQRCWTYHHEAGELCARCRAVVGSAA